MAALVLIAFALGARGVAVPLRNVTVGSLGVTFVLRVGGQVRRLPDGARRAQRRRDELSGWGPVEVAEYAERISYCVTLASMSVCPPGVR